jgi:small subunit ribosomal protein S6
MKEYELTVLIHPDLEMDLEKPLEKVRAIITGQKGKITNEHNWGKKKLAYRIQKEDFAVYVHMEVELNPDSLIKISNSLNITDEVLRYLLVSIDEKTRSKIAEAAKRRQDKEEEKEE